ncbi:hypothetical protein GUJ93_ZPchr0012g21554, partial [Zizania palustris]
MSPPPITRRPAASPNPPPHHRTTPYGFPKVSCGAKPQARRAWLVSVFDPVGAPRHLVIKRRRHLLRDGDHHHDRALAFSRRASYPVPLPSRLCCPRTAAIVPTPPHAAAIVPTSPPFCLHPPPPPPAAYPAAPVLPPPSAAPTTAYPTAPRVASAATPPPLPTPLSPCCLCPPSELDHPALHLEQGGEEEILVGEEEEEEPGTTRPTHYHILHDEIGIGSLTFLRISEEHYSHTS